jgi:hypothetical protein
MALKWDEVDLEHEGVGVIRRRHHDKEVVNGLRRAPSHTKTIHSQTWNGVKSALIVVKAALNWRLNSVKWLPCPTFPIRNPLKNEIMAEEWHGWSGSKRPEPEEDPP